MSYQAVHWALYDAPMLRTGKDLADATARQVLVVLAEHADEHGRNARPSVLRIRYATGLDERTIQRALLRLERAGVIAREGTWRGVVRWRLALATARPESDWDDLEAEAEETKRVESERRAQRRNRAAAAAVSGTQDPGHPTAEHAFLDGPADPVRDAESRSPAFSVPESGTQSADVRDAAPPEPPMNHPGTTQRTSPGGTLPPDPLRPQAPPSSGLGNETARSNSGRGDQPREAVRNHRPRACEDDRGPPHSEAA